MNVETLERIARESHNGAVETLEERSGHRDGLSEHEWKLGLSIAQRIEGVRASYPNQTMLAAELGCFTASAVEDMDNLPGVEAFGIDLKPYLVKGQNLSPDRLIVADLNDMPHVPDESFQYVWSFNCLGYTDPTKSLPEIYRVLMPGGVADLDIEFWQRENPERIAALPIATHLKIRGVATQPSGDGICMTSYDLGTVAEFLATYQQRCKEDKEFNYMVMPGTYFMMSKPKPNE